LLIKVTLKYPQGIIFTLLLNSQSNSKRRKNAASKLITRLRDQKSVFVDQAETISTEIQRVAILQQEEWYFANDIG
jgi:phosphatidylinositol kinase/protein kinase (PI-3  family)